MRTFFRKIYSRYTSNPSVLDDFFHVLGFKPKDDKLFILALTHASHNSETGKKNERLEFIGDAVLSMVVSEFLYEKYPDKDEGFLTKIRSRIVSRESLNFIGHDYKVQDYLLHKMDEKQLTSDHNTIGNAFEALIGAIYLEMGLYFTVKFIRKHIIEKYINLLSLEQDHKDYKSLLVEKTQAEKRILEFRTDKSDQKEELIFKAEIWVDDNLVSEGFGKSKKAAEQVAAKEALEKLV